MNATKFLILAASVAAASQSYAMQALSDSSMSNATGQDGIDITLANTNVAVDYIRFGSSGTSVAAYSGAADLQIAGFSVSSSNPTDIQIRLGSNSAGQAAVLLNISANQLKFGDMTLSLNKWSGVQSDLTADTNQQSAGGGMFTLRLGTVTLPAAAITLTQGFTDQTSGKAMSGDGITLAVGAQTGVDIKGFGILTTPDAQKAGNVAYLFGAQDIAITGISANNISIGAVNGAAATAAGLGGNIAANGALWLSMGASTIAGVDVANIMIGNGDLAQPTTSTATGTGTAAAPAFIGSLGLAGVHLGANNVFISALK